MEHILGDHKEHPNQQENQNLCDEIFPVMEDNCRKMLQSVDKGDPQRKKK